MYVTRHSDQRCCTCRHWQGIRVTEMDGHIYSLKNVEGICRNSDSAEITDTSGLSLSFPQDTCAAWAKWEDPACSNIPQSGQAKQYARASNF